MNPQELMKSRYTAFINEDWEYICSTSTCQSLEDFKDYPSIDWLKLDLLDAYDNIVEFKAYYRDDEGIKVLHEKSTFIQKNGMWKYQAGELYNSKIERNEICPCGSGKKYKKCCAKN